MPPPHVIDGCFGLVREETLLTKSTFEDALLRVVRGNAMLTLVRVGTYPCSTFLSDVSRPTLRRQSFLPLLPAMYLQISSKPYS